MAILRFSPGSCRRNCVACSSCGGAEGPRKWTVLLPWKTYVLTFWGYLDSPPTCVWRLDVSETIQCPETRQITRVELRLDTQADGSRRITLFVEEDTTVLAVWSRALSALDCAASYTLPKTGGECSTTTAATIVPQPSCCPCGAATSSGSSGRGCQWCTDRAAPAALQVTFTGIANGSFCSDCPTLNATFLLATYDEFDAYCYWEYRAPLACGAGGFFLLDAFLQGLGGAVLLVVRLVSVSKGGLVWRKFLCQPPTSPYFCVDCLNLDQQPPFDATQSSQIGCTGGASTCRVVAIP